MNEHICNKIKFGCCRFPAISFFYGVNFVCSKFLEKLGKNEKLKDVLINLGSNNKATYAAIAIAITKGIFRPIATMLDKKEDKKTRQYTACREALTEVIAVPSYWVCGELASKLAEKFQKDPAKLKVAKANLGFIGVCFATLIVIPGLCSVAIKPITNKIFGNQDKKPQPQEKKTLDISENPGNEPKFGNLNTLKKPNTPLQSNKISSLYNININNGMKVG